MRYILTTLLLLTQLSSADLLWQKDLTTAFEKAAKEQKPLMILVEKEGCGWCTKIKKETLQDKQIANRLKEFIIVKVNKEEIGTQSILYAKMVPTIYFLDHNKKIVERVIGYCGVLDFNSWIDDAQAKLK